MRSQTSLGTLSTGLLAGAVEGGLHSYEGSNQTLGLPRANHTVKLTLESPSGGIVCGAGALI